MISELMICGGIAGAVSSSVTYPLDLARSRLAVELNCQKSAVRLEVIGLIFELLISSLLIG